MTKMKFLYEKFSNNQNKPIFIKNIQIFTKKKCMKIFKINNIFNTIKK